MSFFDLYESMHIDENVAQARKNYVDTGKIPLETFQYLRAHDPTNNGKYVEWMCREYDSWGKDFQSEHQLNLLLDTVKTFDTLLNKNLIPKENRDITKMSFQELERVVQTYQHKQTKSEFKRRVKGETEIIKDDEADYEAEMEQNRENAYEATKDALQLILKEDYFEMQDNYGHITLDDGDTYNLSTDWDTFYRRTDQQHLRHEITRELMTYFEDENLFDELGDEDDSEYEFSNQEIEDALIKLGYLIPENDIAKERTASLKSREPEGQRHLPFPESRYIPSCFSQLFEQEFYRETPLLEGVASARKKYLDSGLIPQEVFEELEEHDPSKHGKYMEWMCRELANMAEKSGADVAWGNTSQAIHWGIITTMEDIVGKFDELVKRNIIPKEKRDFTKMSYQDMKSMVRELRDVETKSQSKKKAKGEAEVIQDDENATVLIPLSRAAILKYGKGTRWCIASDTTSSYLNDYVKNGIWFIMILPKKDIDHVHSDDIPLDYNSLSDKGKSLFGREREKVYQKTRKKMGLLNDRIDVEFEPHKEAIHKKLDARWIQLSKDKAKYPYGSENYRQLERDYLAFKHQQLKNLAAKKDKISSKYDDEYNRIHDEENEAIKELLRSILSNSANLSKILDSQDKYCIAVTPNAEVKYQVFNAEDKMLKEGHAALIVDTLKLEDLIKQPQPEELIDDWRKRTDQ